MWYVILARDNPDSLPLRAKARAAHLARLEELQQQGRLLTAGPLPAIDGRNPGPAGFVGSLLVVDFESLDAAREWANADPYREAGVYGEVEVHPYKQVFPK